MGIVTLFVASLYVGSAPSFDDDPAYAALRAHVTALREAEFQAPPVMPAPMQVQGLAPLMARDAVVMPLPPRSGAEPGTELLIVSDVADIEEAVLTGNLRGGTFFVAELATGTRADGDVMERTFNFNTAADRSPYGRYGAAQLQVFDRERCDNSTPLHTATSGYIKLMPSRDPQRSYAVLNIGLGAGEVLTGRVAVRSIAWIAHLPGLTTLTCSR